MRSSGTPSWWFLVPPWRCRTRPNVRSAAPSRCRRRCSEVNEHNFQKGWPEIEMGIALHTGEVVVGNIGSTKRSKYGVIGQPVNLTARIESFTVGGQVLVSPTLISAVDQGLILGDEVKVHGKGMQEALRCRELLGHEDHPELLLKEEEPIFTTLADPLPFYYVVLTDKHLDGQMQPATLVSISQRRAVVEVSRPVTAVLQHNASVGGGERRGRVAGVVRQGDPPSRRIGQALSHPLYLGSAGHAGAVATADRRCQGPLSP